MGPHQGKAEGKEKLPRPAAHTPLDAPQDPTGLLGTQGMLLAHGHLVVPPPARELDREEVQGLHPADPGQGGG